MKYICLILAALCFIYCALVYLTFSGTLFHLVWLALGIGFILLFYALKLQWFSLLPKTLKTFFLIFIGIIFLFFCFIEYKIGSHFNDTVEEDVDYVVVLGAQVRRNGPSVVLKYRLDTAYSYLQNHPTTLCIVSGGQGANEPFAEAIGMKEYLVQKGLDASRILIEDQSLNTIQNILYSSKLLNKEEDSIALVTNNFHIYRALCLAKTAGYRHVHTLSAYSNPLYLPNNMLREFIGFLKDLFVGNIQFLK
ncbi:MAG: YdcF family protein [Solobacterium sp.]|nr:YdcF family protein [Solobacterium sp.]